MKQDLDHLVDLVEKWAFDRHLEKQEAGKQMLKVVEEVGELAAGLARNNRELIQDSIGDVLVTLIILSLQLDMNLFDCLELAYEEIKNRKGKLVNGVFVKEGEIL